MRTFLHNPDTSQQTTFSKADVVRQTHLEGSREVSSGLHLQRTLGNQAGQRLFQPRPEASARKVVNRNSAIPTSGHMVLGSFGQSLASNTRSLMELPFGHDFSHVRVHTNSQAIGSAHAMNAIAYTVGGDVVLPQYVKSVSGSRILAHELAHVVQQTGGGEHSDTPLSISAPNHRVESEANSAADAVMAGHSYHPILRTGLAMHRQALPLPSATLAGLTATRVAFNNSGTPNRNNCAVVRPSRLGVDGPGVGLNGMEMIFRINGVIPQSTEFDITRTVADGLWQQIGGGWVRLGGLPAGTNDDHHDDDECLTPANTRIFVVDTPGIVGGLNPGGRIRDIGPVSPIATAAVWKLSFAEWVIARNRQLGIGWQRISNPTFHRWHSILSVSLVRGNWRRVNTPLGEQNEIELGSTRTTGATP